MTSTKECPMTLHRLIEFARDEPGADVDILIGAYVSAAPDYARRGAARFAARLVRAARRAPELGLGRLLAVVRDERIAAGEDATQIETILEEHADVVDAFAVAAADEVQRRPRGVLN